MGRTVTPTFRVEYGNSPTRGYTAHGWDTRHNGRATIANLDRFMAATIASTRPGGCNAHLGPSGFAPSYAKIVRQATGEVVATWPPLHVARQMAQAAGPCAECAGGTATTLVTHTEHPDWSVDLCDRHAAQHVIIVGGSAHYLYTKRGVV